MGIGISLRLFDRPGWWRYLRGTALARLADPQRVSLASDTQRKTSSTFNNHSCPSSLQTRLLLHPAHHVRPHLSQSPCPLQLPRPLHSSAPPDPTALRPQLFPRKRKRQPGTKSPYIIAMKPVRRLHHERWKAAELARMSRSLLQPQCPSRKRNH
jgi:hypothetical protein